MDKGTFVPHRSLWKAVIFDMPDIKSRPHPNSISIDFERNLGRAAFQGWAAQRTFGSDTNNLGGTDIIIHPTLLLNDSLIQFEHLGRVP